MSRTVQSSRASLGGSTTFYVASVVGIGAVITAASVNAALAQPYSAGWLFFLGLALVTGYAPVKVPGIDTRFSLSDVLSFTSILLFGVDKAVVVSGIDALIASRFNRGDANAASRTLFNVAASAIAVWIPGTLVAAIAPGVAFEGSALWWSVLAVAAMVASYSLLSTGLVAIVLALTHGTGVREVWRKNFSWVWIAHAWSALAAAAIATSAPYVTVFSLVVIAAVGAVGYATVRVYLREVAESTSHMRKLNDLYLATIKALAMAIDAKDQVTHGHIRRVQCYAVGLARALGITDELSLKGIEAGALLHDTGKIAVPEHILNKPGKLTPAEYERMKSHVTVGADILSGIHFPFPVIPYVRHHHESWDGSGYPDGLKGEDIPFGARILAVVDCYDALTSDRPYRRALTTDAAIAILRERSGTMYDPRVVEAFVRVLPELQATLEVEDHPAVADARSGTSAAQEPVVDMPPPAAHEDLPELDDLLQLATTGWLMPAEAAFVLTNRLRPRLRFATCAVYVPHMDDDRLEAIHVSGRHAELFRHSALRLAEGLSGWVAAHGKPVLNADPTLDLQGPVADCQIELASALVVPFPIGQGSRGALALYATGPNAFTLDDAAVANAAAMLLGRALRSPAAVGSDARKSA